MNWEDVNKDTQRLRVPGGWLYRSWVRRTRSLYQGGFMTEDQATEGPEFLQMIYVPKIGDEE